MKKSIFLVMITVMTVFTTKAQVAINTTNSAPNNFSMLDVSGSQKGILIPRMTTADRTGMAGSMGVTEEGLTVYDTDTKSFWFWDGSAWTAVGSAAMSNDKDWFKEGTTDAPNDINDKMYHMGQVAIGKNTATSQLDIYSATQETLFNAKLENPNDVALRLGASIDLDGAPITTHGKVGVYTTVGGDPGTSSYPILEGFEADIIGENGVDKDQYGLYTYVTGDNAGIHAGLSTYLNGGSTGDRYANYNYISGSSSGKNFLFYGYDNNSGDGVHFGNFNLLTGSGNGVQYGGYNRIWNSGTGKQVGIFNEIYSKGASAHAGTINLIGAKTQPENPNNITPVSGDSDGKRIGSINTILGDGDGLHVGGSNVILSTGNGTHLGMGNVLGHNYVTNTNTSTTGYHLGTLNMLTDLGAATHVGSANVMGIVLDPNDPTNFTPVTGDSDAKRIGELNTIGGDGNGQHFGIINSLLSTGSGELVGTSNVIGYDFYTQQATNASGDEVGTLNSVNSTGAGLHYGNVNFIGYDHINKTEINSDGIHVGTGNLLAGGQTGSALQGLQVGTSNVIIAKSDVTSATSLGLQYGSMNIIGRNPSEPLSGNTNNGDGTHYATYNEVADSGDGLHIASFNKVTADGAGQHIAVFGEVDAADNTAFAGAFKGDVTARNYVTTIPFLSGRKLTNTNSSYADYLYVGSALDPTIFNKLGQIEVKMIVRVYSKSGSNSSHIFRLHAKNNTQDIFPIDQNDTWTWTAFPSGRYMVSSEWKVWNAGTDNWYLSLNTKNVGGNSISIDQVYILVRPVQF